MENNIELTKEEIRQKRLEATRRWRKRHPDRYHECVRRWESRNPEKAKEYSRKFRANNPEKFLQWGRLWRERNQQKKIAHLALARAIEKGIIIRPDTCPCGNPNPQGHHQDYSKPLMVVWVCQGCHAKLHLRIKGGRNK